VLLGALRARLAVSLTVKLLVALLGSEVSATLVSPALLSLTRVAAGLAASTASMSLYHCIL